MTRTDEAVVVIDEERTASREQAVAAAAIAWAARQTVAAHNAGMPIRSARRWPRYLAFKAKRGEVPISLQDAVGQVLVARAVARRRT